MPAQNQMAAQVAALKIPLRGLVRLGQCNLMSEGFQPLDQVSSQPQRLKFIQVVGPEFLVVTIAHLHPLLFLQHHLHPHPLLQCPL